MIYALDTNTIIHLLNNDQKAVKKRNEAVQAGIRFVVPPFVDYEVQRGLLYNPSHKKERMYADILNHYGVGNMTANMWKKAASIYVDLKRRSFTVSDADILIAAFCIISDYTLVTRNIRDFANIHDLSTINWIE